MTEQNPYRLSRNVVPSHYDLTLTPDLDESTFAGVANITIEIVEATNTIQLNAIELEILSAEIKDADGNTLTGTVTLNEESEVATIALPSDAHSGNWTLQTTFTGILNDKLRGFYRSTFVDDNGSQRVIATTQFEATDARRAFPCWDEPDFKAVFAVTLIVDENLAAFSNGEVESVTNLGNGKKQVEFVDTMKMSTYLVAFVVGPLVETEVVDQSGTPLKVACVPGREHLAAFALEAGTSALEYFANYFDIPYPGGKLDLISLPDFAFGAMENLGCVTFRETALLVDPQRASRGEIERVADVVGHEIAHMWFGDLVTMKWWNGIWLNEAFATFMEVSFVDYFRPEWERWVSFSLGKAAAMSLDSLSSTRPIEFEVVKPEEASGMFDLLTYQKGGAVLRMLEQHLGAETFRRGIAEYLRKFSYSNAETGDLWDALEESSGQPVRSMMDSWIFQGGHPIVHVAKGADGKSLELSQKRFQYLENTNENSGFWHIPVGIRSQVGGSFEHSKVVLTESTLTVPLSGEPGWVFANEHANGFFRVSYDTELLHELLSHVDELEPIERFALATDTWAACIAGTVSVEDVLSLIELMKQDSDPNVWGALIGPLSAIDKLLQDDQRAKFVELVQRVVVPLYEELGWEPQDGEAEQISTLRGHVISVAGTLGEYEPARQEALDRYASYEKDPQSLDAELVSATERILASIRGEDHYERLYKKFSSDASTPQEQVRALEALGCFSEKTLVERTLQMILDGQVRSQDAPYSLRIMLGRRNTGIDVWKWCAENWETLAERFPDNSITRMLDGVTAQFDPTVATDVETFMAKHPVPQGQKSVDQTCERLRVNVAFYQRNVDKVRALFS